MDADVILLALAQRQRGLVHRRDVTAAGVSIRAWQRRVAKGEWVRVSVDVWRHALVPETWQLRARAGMMYLGVRAALFGATASAWWGLEIPPPEKVEFLVPRDRRGLSNDLALHTAHRWSTRDLLRADGVQLVSPTLAIIQLAGSGRYAHEVENAIDSAIRLRKTSLPTLIGRMSEADPSTLRGRRLLRALLLDAGGESYLERRFLRLMRLHRLPRPQCQVVHRHGDRVRRVDFEFRGTNVVVEVSGRLGHVSDRERQKDARRRNALQQSGIVVLEFTTADVLDDSPYVVETVRASLRSADVTPS